MQSLRKKIQILRTMNQTKKIRYSNTVLSLIERNLVINMKPRKI